MVLGSFGGGNDVNVGIGTSAPDNRLEIASTATGLPAGTSGLRLSSIAGYIPTSNTNTALTIDNTTGDVVLRNIVGASGVVASANNGLSLDPANSSIAQLGNEANIGSATAQLLNDREIPMNDWNIFFSDPVTPTSSKNLVKIGGSTSATLGKFSVFNSTERINSLFMNLNPGTLIPPVNVAQSIFGVVSNSSLSLFNCYSYTGVRSEIEHGAFHTSPFNSNIINITYDSYIHNSDANINICYNGNITANSQGGEYSGNVININATGNSNSTRLFGSKISVTGSVNTTENYGGYSLAKGSGGSFSYPNNTYGGYFEAHGGNSFNNIYGIKTKASGPAGYAFMVQRYGIWSEVNNNIGWAGYFVGNVYTTASQYYTSDSKLKKNTGDITNSRNIISQLKPHTFNFDTTTYSFMNLPVERQFGLYADEADSIVPELVKDITFPKQLDSAGNVISPEVNFKGLNYIGLIPIAIQAIKELDSISSGLSGRIDSINVKANNGLTVDINKNVQLGGTLILPQTTINLNDKNLFFSDPSSPQFNTNAVAIGAFLPWSKFSVNNVTSSCAGNFNVSTNSGGWNWGVQASCSGGNPNVGAQLTASGGSYNYGLISSAINGSYVNYGLMAGAAGGQYNTAGYFDGDLVYTGNFYKASDSLLKENINPVSDAMNLISQLEPKTFNFKTAQYPYLNLPTGTIYGLIAQDVETVIPGVVTTNIHPEQKDANGNILSPELAYKGLNYEELIPLMIQGMKEQQGVIDSLESQVNYLQSIIGTVQKTSNDNNTQYVELENVNAIILNQNDPNPFAEETNITYYIPDDVSDAKLMFYDNNGKVIKEVELTAKGNGTLHVYASNLSSGIYTYALIADGKVIDTKKMVCSK